MEWNNPRMRVRPARVGLALSFCLLIPAAGPVRSPAGEWTALTDRLRDPVPFKINAHPQDTVAVDRTTGILIVNRYGGLYTSRDRGESFSRVEGDRGGGGSFAAWSIASHPEGGKHLVVSCDCSALQYTEDGGKTWENRPNRIRFDYCAADWDSMSFIGAPHESTSILLSTDGAKTWQPTRFKDNGDPHWGVGIFSPTELVVFKEGIQRSADGGQTWTPVLQGPSCVGSVLVSQGIGYWMANQEGKGRVLITRDKGLTWTVMGKPLGAPGWFGPCFGRDKSLFVLGQEGILETTDAGEHWTLVTAYPPGAPEGNLKTTRYSFGLAYDPQQDIFYLSAPRGGLVGATLWRYVRSQAPAGK
jgi:photosystem II stability/assembly factor-like uncharacterized protein